MLNDPSPLPDCLPEAPNEADYQAVYAELTATARGSVFLKTFASRNLHPDAQRFVGTVARLEAAMRDNQPPPVPDALLRNLAELAAMIAHAEAALAAGASAAADHFFAIERIQDIAMAFRRREIEPALCDALETAAREVGDAVVRNKAAASAWSAAALLQDLAGRVNGIIALVAPVAGVGNNIDSERPAGAETPAHAATAHYAEPVFEEKAETAGGHGEPNVAATVETLFEASLNALANAELSEEGPHNKEPPMAFATVEVLAGAELPSEDSPNEEVAAAPTAAEVLSGVGLSSEAVHTEEPIVAFAAAETAPCEEFLRTDSRLDDSPREHERIEELPNVFALGEESAPMDAVPALETAASVDGAARNQQDSPNETVSEALGQPARDEIAGNDNDAPFVGAVEAAAQEFATNTVEAGADDDDDLDFLLLQPLPLPTALPDAWAQAGPDEDPADLFESPPLPVSDPLLESGQQEAGAVGAGELESPSQDSPTEAVASSLSTQSLPAAVIDAVSPQPAASATAQPISRATAMDPLAAVLALSEDELIALFS